LFGLVLLSSFGRWFLVITALAGLGLFVALGSLARPWIILLTVGAFLVLPLTAIVLFCFMYVILLPRKRFFYPAIMATGLATIIFVAKVMFSTGISIPTFSPMTIGLVLFLALTLAIGPLAHFGGALYVKAFTLLQGYSPGRRRFKMRNRYSLARLITQRRTPIAALLLKEFRCRSRSPIAIVRVAIMGAGLLGLYLFGPLLRQSPLPRTMTAVAAVLVLVQITLNEIVINAIAGEGDRLAVYLSSPLEFSRLLTAKLTAFLTPVLLEELFVTVAVGIWLRLTGAEIVYVTIAGILILTANTSLLVFGSAWDTDLGLAIEGTAQMIVNEEAFVTPKRVMLFIVSMIFQGTALLFLTIPPIFALTGLFVFASFVFLLSRRLGLGQLKSLVR